MDGLSDKLTVLITNAKAEMISNIESVQEKLTSLEMQVSDQADSIQTLCTENQTLHVNNQLLEGRVTRNEKLISDLHEGLLDITSRGMRDNVIFQNIHEKPNETLGPDLRKFMTDEMKMSQRTMNGVNLKRAHRIGKPRSSFTRPIVAVFEHESVDVVMRHARNLKGKQFGVNVQLPRELEERKKQLLPVSKDAKQNNKTVKWSKDKLYIDGVRHTAHNANKPSIMNTDVTEKAASTRVLRSPPKVYGGSTFQGAKVGLSCQDDILPAIHALYRDTRTAAATHNNYAYRLTTPDGVVEHYDDDGEYGGGRRILRKLKDGDDP